MFVYFVVGCVLYVSLALLNFETAFWVVYRFGFSQRSQRPGDAAKIAPLRRVKYIFKLGHYAFWIYQFWHSHAQDIQTGDTIFS
ncbi:MAG: hypothetical protein Q8941_22310 [Bacteroidota bacterium]|nr:hypothetical protein [Bacteroidota bacterium]